MFQRGSHDVSRRHVLGIALGAVTALAFQPNVAQQPKSYTFAVLGTDYRSPEDPELTDVLMVSRVDLDAATVRTLSIPRDLYVEIPGHGYAKINAAYNFAVKTDPEQRWEVGAASTVVTIEHNFDLQIDGVAQTDLSVFPQIIDAVGGVNVDNPYAFYDDTYFKRGFPAGELQLNGADALVFCRIRVPDGDGGRVMRQHLVLRAILAKLREPALLARLPNLIGALSGEVIRTDIPAVVQTRLIAVLPSITSDNLAFTNIEDQLWSDYTDSGAWIYQGDWSTLPGYVQSWLAGL